MRLAAVTTFHDTVSCCFNSVLEKTGTSVCDVIYERLEGWGIPISHISTRFDDVVAILNESLLRKSSSDHLQDVSRALSGGTTAVRQVTRLVVLRTMTVVSLLVLSLGLTIWQGLLVQWPMD